MKNLLLVFTAVIMLTSCSTTNKYKGVENVGSITVESAASDLSSEADISSLSNQKKCWGQGHNLNEKNQPVSSIEYNNIYKKYGGVFIGEAENTMYLTFDEGYENGYTEQILDTLKEKKVSALFFVTYDYVKRNDGLIRRMINEGHIIGNHTWSHPSMPDVSAEDCKSEIKKLHDYMVDNYNYKMTYIRPPKGEFSERTLVIAKNLEYKSIFWSFAYKDYDVNSQPDPTSAFNRITSASHDGAIYLLHAVSKTNADILGQVIDKWRDDGYKISKFDI